MKYRKFGTTDLMVSEVGFGAWAIGGGAMVGETPIGWGDANDDESIDALHAALDAGINFFDTADIYGLGHSESLIGNVIGNRSDVVIATKVGNVARNNQFTVDYKKEYIIDACEKSLQRLRRDCIDYYQLHTAKVDHLNNGECIDAMQLLQQQGKIRYWGLSLNTFHPTPEASWLMQNHLGNGFQLVLNIINQLALPLIKDAATNGYGIIARMPLQFGLLTGKFDASSSFPDNDHRQKRLVPEIIDKFHAIIPAVWQLCDKYSISKTQLAMSYILSYPEVSTVIPGIRKISHVKDNTTNIVQLDKADMQLIEAIGQNEMLDLMQKIQKQG